MRTKYDEFFLKMTEITPQIPIGTYMMKIRMLQ